MEKKGVRITEQLNLHISCICQSKQNCFFGAHGLSV